MSLVIEGGSFSVDGQGTSGVRPFDIAANTTVTMNDITVTGGNANGNGGGILNHGTLTLADSIITGNAVSSPNNGGGIHNGSGGTLAVNRSTISNNTAGNQGGGIGNFGALTVTDSTITGNTALDRWRRHLQQCEHSGGDHRQHHRQQHCHDTGWRRRIQHRQQHDNPQQYHLGQHCEPKWRDL